MSDNGKPRGANRRWRDPTMWQVQETLEIATSTKAAPEVIEGLKKALLYADLREDYTLQCTSQESDTCRKIRETTQSHPWAELKEQGKTLMNLTPMMLSGRLEGQFLKSLVSGQGAKRVLDVGMYTGYSAQSMAEALPADGEVVTLDMDPYLKQHNQPLFAAFSHGAKITVKIGPAIQTMRDMLKEGQKFDFIFLDADKSEYTENLKIAFEEGLLAQNGTVAVDNAYRDGNNYLPSDQPPDAARLFGEHVANDSSLHKVLVPIRDGVMLIRRVSEVEGGSSRR